jgi:hypothetical protein
MQHAGVSGGRQVEHDGAGAGFYTTQMLTGAVQDSPAVTAECISGDGICGCKKCISAVYASLQGGKFLDPPEYCQLFKHKQQFTSQVLPICDIFNVPEHIETPKQKYREASAQNSIFFVKRKIKKGPPFKSIKVIVMNM